MATSTTENFVPELNRVLNSTEKVTLEATQALMNKGIDTEVVKFKGYVKGKIAETRARLNGLPANAVSPARGAPAPGAPAPGAPAPAPAPPAPAPPAPAPGAPAPAPAPANSTVVPTTEPPRVNVPPIGSPVSPSDKLSLLRILNESLINTIQQVIEQMGTGNTEFIRRALGYIQILLIQLQNLVVIFNRLDKRLGNIEKRLGMGRNTSTNTSQPDLESLRKQLEEVMRLAPTPPTAPARKGWFRFFGKKGGYSRKLSKTKRKLRRKAPATARKRAGHKKASRKK